MASQLGKEASWHEPPHGYDAIDDLGWFAVPGALGSIRVAKIAEVAR